MNLIPSFLKSLFKPKSFVPASEVAPVAPPQFAKTRNQKRTRHLWLDRKMEQITGTGTVLIEYPKQLGGKEAQRLVCQRLIARFGKGGYSTRLMPRLFQIRVTIH